MSVDGLMDDADITCSFTHPPSECRVAHPMLFNEGNGLGDGVGTPYAVRQPGVDDDERLGQRTQQYS